MTYLDDLADLSGRSAVVVGGGGGLGALSSRALAKSGVSVISLDLDEQVSQQLERELGAQVRAMVGDARDASALDRLAGEVGPSLDILVNVVGGTFFAEFDSISDNAVDALIRLNFSAPVMAIRRLLPALRQGARRSRGGGAAIINVTSSEAHRGAPSVAVYAAMKAAMASLSASLAVELAPDGIRVNALAPDIIETPALAKLIGHNDASAEAIRARYSATIPLARGGEAEDWAGGLLFLASGLSRYLTGSTLRLDGGTSAAPGFTRWDGDGWAPFLPHSVSEKLEKITRLGTRPPLP